MTVSMLSHVGRGEHGEALGEVCISRRFAYVVARIVPARQLRFFRGMPTDSSAENPTERR
jgi:hypothetical protein